MKSREANRKKTVLQDMTDSENVLDLCGMSFTPSIVSTPRHIRRIQIENDTEREGSSETEDHLISGEGTDDSSSDNKNQNTTIVEWKPVSEAEWRVHRSKDPPKFPFLIKTGKNFSIPKTPME